MHEYTIAIKLTHVTSLLTLVPTAAQCFRTWQWTDVLDIDAT